MPLSITTPQQKRCFYLNNIQLNQGFNLMPFWLNLV